jgi:hypothetical protein
MLDRHTVKEMIPTEKLGYYQRQFVLNPIGKIEKPQQNAAV